MNNTPQNGPHFFKPPYSSKQVWLEYMAKRAASSKAERFPFITISRQGGAGGHELADALLEEMNKRSSRMPVFQEWQAFDNEICEKVVQDQNLKIAHDFLMAEKYRSEIQDFFSQIMKGESPQYSVVRKIFECVRGMANMGKAIIVGRGAVCVTHDLPLGVHVRLVGSLAGRVERTMRLRGISKAEALKLVETWDRDRAHLIHTFFSKKNSDPLLYDVIWNVDRTPFSVMASAIVDMVEAKMKSLG